MMGTGSATVCAEAVASITALGAGSLGRRGTVFRSFDRLPLAVDVCAIVLAIGLRLPHGLRARKR
jgi:hypothetical protein